MIPSRTFGLNETCNIDTVNYKNKIQNLSTVKLHYIEAVVQTLGGIPPQKVFLKGGSKPWVPELGFQVIRKFHCTCKAFQNDRGVDKCETHFALPNV